MALLAALWASAAPGAAERPEDRWNLADLYPSVNAWADDAARLEAQLKEFAACRGQLGESARRLKACLDARADFTKRYARLEVYASELFDEDTGLPESLELSEKTRILGTRLEEATSFLRPEILRLGKARLERFSTREKSLAIYRHPLDRILRAAAHTLDSSGESIVAAFALSKEAAGSTRQILANIYEPLIGETNRNLPPLHLYFRLRARLLGIKGEMRYYDIYPPLVSSARKYPIDEGKKMMLEAVKPLGERYVAAMAAGLQNRWMDVYPRPRKLSGAHMDGAAYDVHPFVLMNYNDNYESVSTLVHEWGHAMHSYLSNAAQPFVTSDYAIFVAEIASTFNEALLLQHVLRNAADDNERLLYLGTALENLRGTFFRQAMFAEFEREVHARVDRGEPLSGDKLTQIYGEILRRYHGDKEGVVKIDDLYAVEWAYIPHFYRPFYVFQYATSIAASSLFADAVLKGEPGARERYLELLSAGGSDYPYELVKAAGVDLASPAPYRAVVARMNRIMDEIEAIQARR